MAVEWIEKGVAWKKNEAMNSCTTQPIFTDFNDSFGSGLSVTTPSAKDITCYLNELSFPISSSLPVGTCQHSNFHDSDPILITFHSFVRQMVCSYTIIRL